MFKNENAPFSCKQFERKPFAISTSIFHVLDFPSTVFFSLNHFLQTMTFALENSLACHYSAEVQLEQQTRDLWHELPSASLNNRRPWTEVDVLPKINFLLATLWISSDFFLHRANGVKLDTKCVRNAFSNLIKWHRRIIIESIAKPFSLIKHFFRIVFCFGERSV